MVNLQDIIDAIDMVFDEITPYLDTETGEVVSINEFEPDSSREIEALMEEEPDRFLRLPGKHEINEYGMMEDFIDGLPEGRQKRALEKAIDGRGAFRRFKDAVCRFDLEEDWYAFRAEGLYNVARQWCEDNDVAYEGAAETPDDSSGVVIPISDYRPGGAASGQGPLDALLSALLNGDGRVEVAFDAGEEEDGEDDGDPEAGFTPRQAAGFYELYEQLGDIQAKLEALAGTAGGEAAADAISGAAENVSKARDCLKSIVEGGIDVVVDARTSPDEIERLAALVRRLAGADEPEE